MAVFFLEQSRLPPNAAFFSPINNAWISNRTGANEYLVARPELYNILLRQIPKEKIQMSKKVLSFMQNEDGVMIRCADNQTHHGDILVGADGAHSAVRQHLYKELKQKKKLPSSDDVPLPFNCVCLVGQTEVMDPEEFPDLNLPHSKFNTVLGSNDFSVSKRLKINVTSLFQNTCTSNTHFWHPVGSSNHKTKHGVLDSSQVPYQGNFQAT